MNYYNYIRIYNRRFLENNGMEVSGRFGLTKEGLYFSQQ